MTITFNDSNDVILFTIYDIESDPFSLGDIINLSIDEMYPKDTENASKEQILEWRELREKYTNRKVKLISKFDQINVNYSRTSIEREYTVQIQPNGNI